MKKLMFLASLFAVFSVSAQDRTQSSKTTGHQKVFKHQGKKPSVENELKRFDDYNLSSTQKEQLKTLFEEREKNFVEKVQQEKSQREDYRKEFDSKIQEILDNEQYEKYTQDRVKKSNFIKTKKK